MSRAPIDIDACARHLEERMRLRQDAAQARADRLRGQAREAARVLRDDFGATRTWLFGSLAWGDPHQDSDVDLLVEGLPAARATEAERRVAALVDAAFDLVLLEEAAPGLVERVLAEGVPLHDAP